jgi:2',3'-cyclic-nucleotide 2'-phosphodiesterase (5'-nucleotidase family)
MASIARFALVVVVGCGPPSTPARRGVVIGATSVDIDTRLTATRVGEAPIGNFLADTLRDAVTAMGDDVTVALVNAGTIRGGRTTAESVPAGVDAKLGRVYPAGDLTDDDVLGWDPFRDNHVAITVTGAQLKSALERGAAQLPPDLRIDGGGPLLHVSGARYTIDCAGDVQIIDVAQQRVAREGTRVVRLEVDDRLLYDVAGGVDALDGTEVRIAVNTFVADGFDGHLALGAGTDTDLIPFDVFNLADAAVARVRASSPIAPRLEGRITIVGDCGRPLTLP